MGVPLRRTRGLAVPGHFEALVWIVAVLGGIALVLWALPRL